MTPVPLIFFQSSYLQGNIVIRNIIHGLKYTENIQFHGIIVHFATTITTTNNKRWKEL